MEALMLFTLCLILVLYFVFRNARYLGIWISVFNNKKNKIKIIKKLLSSKYGLAEDLKLSASGRQPDAVFLIL